MQRETSVNLMDEAKLRVFKRNMHVEKVISNEKIIEGVYKIVFERDPEFAYKAGQSVMLFKMNLANVSAEDQDEDVLFNHVIFSEKRSYSLVSSPLENELACYYRVVGRFTSYLKNLEAGDFIAYKGPYGRFLLPEKPAEIVYLAIGIGITPVIGHMHHLELSSEYNKYKISLWWGIRTDEENFLKDELKKWQEFARVKIVYSRQDEKKHMQDHLPTIVENDHVDRYYYIVGNTAFMKDMRQKLIERGIERARIIGEGFG